MCGKNLNIVSMCAVSPVVHTPNISSCKKKNFFGFPVAVNSSIKVGPLVFLLQMFVITENIMERPVLPQFVSARAKILSVASYVTRPFIRIQFFDHASYNY